MPALSPYTPRFVTLRTRLSPGECYRRLRPVTLPWIQIMLIIPWAFSKLPLMGWVYPSGFAVRKLTVSFKVATMMQPEAKAQFIAVPDGTLMRVRLGIRRWIAMLSWIGLVYVIIFAEGLAFLLCRLQPNPRCNVPLAFVWPIALPVAIELLAWWSAKPVVRDESAFLINFLKQTLEAEEVPATDTGT